MVTKRSCSKGLVIDSVIRGGGFILDDSSFCQVFNEMIMYKDSLERNKREKENIEYTVLDEIIGNETPKV